MPKPSPIHQLSHPIQNDVWSYKERITPAARPDAPVTNTVIKRKQIASRLVVRVAGPLSALVRSDVNSQTCARLMTEAKMSVSDLPLNSIADT